MEIFEEVVTRYLMMGAGQFLRDFRRDYHIKKSLAHRKTVLIRKEKDKGRRMKVYLSQIEQDRSHRKRSSHACSTAGSNQRGQRGCGTVVQENRVAAPVRWLQGKLPKKLE